MSLIFVKYMIVIINQTIKHFTLNFRLFDFEAYQSFIYYLKTHYEPRYMSRLKEIL